MGKWLQIAGAAVLCTSQTFAQTIRFEGLSLGLNANSARIDSTRALNGLSANEIANSADADFQLQYAWGLGSQFVMSVGTTAGAGALKAGTFGGSEYVLKDRLSFDLLPGFAPSDSMLLYAKLSYLTATATEKFPGSESTTGLSGFGYGVGLRALVEKNWYVQAAYDINQYSEKQTSPTTSLKPDAYLYSLGAGYKF